MGKYRYDIGIGSKYLFGTEIEFTGVYLDSLTKLFKENNSPVRFALSHKSTGYTKYDEWYLDKDGTVTKEDDGKLFGGELSSRILTDKKKAWIELKDICGLLKKAGANANYNCSNHVRVNLSSIQNEPYFFEVLSKLIAIYEPEIKLFYMGDDYQTRRTSFEYARDLSGSLLEYINDIDFNDSDFFYKFKNNRGVTYFTRKDAINLQDYPDKRLMEIRYPNGTVNEKTVQNNINFTLKLIDAIKRELFDPVELSKKVEEGKKNLWLNSLFGKYKTKEFEQLVHTIATSEEDVDDIMSQYEYVLSRKPR